MSRVFVFLSFGFFFLSWHVPVHYFPWRSAPQEFTAFIGAGILMVASARWPVIAPPSLCALLLLSIFPVLQYYLGTIFFLGDAVVSFLYGVFFFLTFIAAYSLSVVRAPAAYVADMLMLSLVSGATLSVLLSISQWLLQSDSSWVLSMSPGRRPYANLGQPNNLATLLGMGLAGLVYFFEKSLVSRFFTSFICALILFGLALTQSRAGWLSFFLICFFWIFKVRSAQVVSVLKVKFVLVWMLVFLFFIFLVPFMGGQLYLNVQPLSDRFSSLGRIELYQQFFVAVLEGPLFGYGWNQVSVAQVLETFNTPVALMVSFTHNLFLDLLVWGGAVGLFLSFLICVWAARTSVVVADSTALSIFSAVLFFLIHSMFEYPYAYAYLLFPVAALLGVLSAGASNGRGLQVPISIFVLLLASVFLVGLFVVKDYWAVEKDYRSIQLEDARILGSERLVGCGPEVYFLTQLKAYACFARLDVSEGLSDTQLSEQKKVVLRYPFAPALYRYALVLASSGREAEAYEQFVLLKGLYGEEAFQKYVEDLRLRGEYHNRSYLARRLDELSSASGER